MEPWGPERADLNAGIIASTVANCHRNSEAKPEPFTPADFMPRYSEPDGSDGSDGMDGDRVKLVMQSFMRRQEARVKAGLS